MTFVHDQDKSSNKGLSEMSETLLMPHKPPKKAEETDGKAALRGREADLEQALEQIRQALTGLRYGQVTAIVQDGLVIQIERMERRRLRRGES
jgi:hypothetical protein